MYANISHTSLPDLSKRYQSELVVKESELNEEKSATMGKPEIMLDCIEEFRSIFLDDFQQRCGFMILEEDETTGDLKPIAS